MNHYPKIFQIMNKLTPPPPIAGDFRHLPVPFQSKEMTFLLVWILDMGQVVSNPFSFSLRHF